MFVQDGAEQIDWPDVVLLPCEILYLISSAMKGGRKAMKAGKSGFGIAVVAGFDADMLIVDARSNFVVVYSGRQRKGALSFA
jgi:hypothetical protein